MTTIGTAVFVVTMRDGCTKFLVGKRAQTCTRGPGVWALPGGMVEDNETIAACARREVFDETGLDVDVEEQDEFMDCVVGLSHHHPRENHMTAWVIAIHLNGEPKVTEPDKCEEWRWVTAKEFLELTPQVGEQMHWAPHRVMRIILPRIGFMPF